MVQRFQYFCRLRHYYRLGLFISVICYLLPVNGAITDKQIQFGAVAVLLSWVNLIQFLQLIPVLGAYIIVVHKVFWTLMKVRILFILVIAMKKGGQIGNSFVIFMIKFYHQYKELETNIEAPNC